MPPFQPPLDPFGPHANAHDFVKYPEMWIATRFMVGLLIFVFSPLTPLAFLGGTADAARGHARGDRR